MRRLTTSREAVIIHSRIIILNIFFSNNILNSSVVIRAIGVNGKAPSSERWGRGRQPEVALAEAAASFENVNPLVESGTFRFDMRVVAVLPRPRRNIFLEEEE